MHRFYLPPEESAETTLFLTNREAHHALHVLRLQTGERIEVLDGAGARILCDISETGRDRVQLLVIQRNAVPPLPCQITLLQAVPKGKIIESIIQKATELGAYRLVPLLSEHVTTRLDPQSSAQKLEKWRQVAIEAIKQCGSAWLPRIESPVTPREFLSRAEKIDLPLVASLQPGSRHAREYFANFRSAHGRKPQSVCVWVGPEGDFTPAEVQSIQASGTLPITLGPLVLRSETAAVYCLSILNHELMAAG